MRRGPRARLTRPFSGPGTGERARTGCPWDGPATDRTVLALWPAFPPSAAAQKGNAGRGKVSACPDPATSLLGVPDSGRRPTETLLAEAQRVLEVEAPDVGPPEQIQVRLARTGPP